MTSAVEEMAVSVGSDTSYDIARRRRLSAAQEELWLIEQENPADPSYHVPFAVWVDGPVDPARLQYALDRLMDRHEALRTTISAPAGQPVAAVLDGVTVVCPVVPMASRGAAMAAAGRLVARPFDDGHPRVRACLYRLPADVHLLVLVLHHAICDGASLWILFEELTEYYDLGPDSAVVPGPEPPDLGAILEAEWAAAESGETDRLARRIADRIGDAPDVADLPYDLGLPRPGLTAGRVLQLPVDGELSTAVDAVVHQAGVTSNAIFLAAWAVVLEILTGAEDILVSVPVSRRRTPAEHRAVGYLVHSVPIRLRPGSCATTAELVRHCADELRLAWTNADASFGRVVRAVQPQRVPGLNPLCQCEFSAPSLPAQPPRLGGQPTRYQYLHNGGFKVSLSLEVVSHSGGRTVALEYPADLFLPTTVNRIGRLYLRLLRQIAASPPSAHLGAVCLVASSEADWLASRSGTVGSARPATLAARIERNIAHHPTTPALVDADGMVSYERLGRRSDEVMEALRAAGVRPGDRVALHGDRTAAFIVAVVGVIRLGASFVAIADDLPAGRVARILELTGASAVLTTASSLLSLLPEDLRHRMAPCPTGWLAVASPGLVAPRHVGEAYTVFTSGSTGTPRGVSVPVTALATVTEAWGEVFGLAEHPGRHLQLAPFSFDVFVGDVARSLGFGGTLVIAERDRILDPPRLLELIRRWRVDTGEFVPSVVRLLVEYLEHSSGPPPALRRVMVGSDTWSVDEARRLRRQLPDDCELYCTYGTSETTIDSTYYRVDEAILPTRGGVPIGVPLPGVLVSVRDRRGRELPPGLPGELWIGGPTVSAGYLAAAELATDRFVAEVPPIASRPQMLPAASPDSAPTRWYRTGDRVVWGRTGHLSLLGRFDDQTKVSGVRVEPVEIEAILADHPRVREVAVVPAGGDGGRQLVAVLVGPDGADLDDIRRHAGEHLNTSVVPTRWRIVDRLPLTRHGKVDRRAVADWAAVGDPDAHGVDSPNTAPGSDLEAVVLGIWREVLSQPEMSPLDDFFDRGGSSVQTARVAWRVRVATGLPITVGDVLRHTTVRALCGALTEGPAGTDDAAARGGAASPGFPAADLVPSAGTPRRLVLAGATGTIGTGVLRELLAGPVEEVLCLVRAAEPQGARARLRAALLRYGADPTLADDDRVVPVPADLTLPDVGLTDRDLDRALTMDALVNASAWVNFIYPYERLAPINVGGVAALGWLAARVRGKALHHVSTQSAVAAPGTPLRGGYNQSKAAAEEVVRHLAAAGYRTSVYRPGFVLGRLVGRRDRPGMLECFLRECVRLGIAPELTGALDVVSADHVARVVATNVLTDRPAEDLDLVNPVRLPWPAAWELLVAHGIPIERVPAEEWLRRVSADRSGDSWFEPFLPLCEEVPLSDLLSDAVTEPFDPAPPGGVAAEPVSEVWRAACEQLMAERHGL
ncbi:AMP-binding protein [Micromonospora sp. NPDC049662]|uniref:non-ribosomal peptide synthetase n=1 Tax=Micromonospora sp. NPDC049662 TaxID=3155397 RepID=UPI00342672CF